MDPLFKDIEISELPLIAVAEANADEMCLISDVLGNRGYRVLGYSDCEKAYKLIERDIPALAIIDVHLPDNCGIGLIRKIRSLDKLRSMPILAIVTASTEKDLAGGGADSFLRRPFDGESLFKTVESLLS